MYLIVTDMRIFINRDVSNLTVNIYKQTLVRIMEERDTTSVMSTNFFGYVCM